MIAFTGQSAATTLQVSHAICLLLVIASLLSERLLVFPFQRIWQYRSAIFTHTAEQARLAEAALVAQQEATPGCLTFAEPAGVFHQAEDYHQKSVHEQSPAACDGPSHSHTSACNCNC